MGWTARIPRLPVETGGAIEEVVLHRPVRQSCPSAVPIGLNRPREDKTDKACAESDEEAHSSTLQDHG